MHEQARRVTDSTEQRDIEKMIAAENDPKVRLQLMVMNRINLSLIANTSTINDVAMKLDAHLTSYEQYTEAEQALLNKGKGAWKVIAWVIAMVQLGGLGIWGYVQQDLSGIHLALEESKINYATIRVRLQVVEEKLDTLNK